ncbi:MAG: CCA tRNA nucleotidyltransferase [Acidobacteriaceae bacterium]|nr:CCA tRNA nucleotidyltransferase [Acidobacteriaceae bacterium]
MSDYMFMLESHLTGDQTKVLGQVRDAAEQANLNLFLTGGAMRDMMGGFPIRDLDFTVEGPAVKFAKSFAETSGARIISVDDVRKSVELVFPGGVSAGIGMARIEKYSKPGARPQVSPGTIHDDLQGRDFTVNAIALSLGKASRGLLLDPTNGLGDLAAKELRATSNHALCDDPSRILRMFRLKARFALTIVDRTLSQYQGVREARLETKIPASAFEYEFRQIARDITAPEILKTLDDEKLLAVLSPALTGAKLNLPGFQKLQKVRQSLPVDGALTVDWYALFLFLLFEKLTSRERSALTQALGIEKAELDAASKLETRATKVEKELAGARITKPSMLYARLCNVSGELLVFLLMRSGQRIVLDRVKNYLQKYLPLAQEVTEKDVIEAGAQPGTPKFAKIQQQLIASKLDARPKKVVVEEPPPPPPSGPGRRSSSFARSIT